MKEKCKHIFVITVAKYLVFMHPQLRLQYKEHGNKSKIFLIPIFILISRKLKVKVRTMESDKIYM